MNQVNTSDHQHTQSESEGDRETEEREEGLEEEGREEEEEEERELKEMAMVALGLLKQEVKVMLQQVKHLVKTNSVLAAQVFTTDVEGWTPVHACALRGKKKVLKAMLQAGVDVNCRMGQPEGLPARCSLLHIAANRHDKKVADYLIHHGADVNAADSFGRTPLFYANRSGNREVAKLLVDSGAAATAVAHGTPEVEVTSAPEEAGRKSMSEELTTPEPKLTRFCFLPLPHHHHHHHQHHHQQHHHHHDRQRHHHRHRHQPGSGSPIGHRTC
ncbi:uncharacterized protein LOC143290895 [Babylonia areolata]|uniref:uncharacterized protein LOC143290895 n=1 Tax=Babylonia areolata TaxID=304850 RepID=UPI003FD24098